MDELERRIREANPAPVRRDTPLSARGEADLHDILSDSPRARRFGWQRAAIWSATIAASLALVLTAVFQFTAPRAAASPPPLEFTPVADSVMTVLERLGEMASQNDSSRSASVIVSETWSLDITVDDTETSTFVQPREITRTFRSDGSVEIVVRAGDVRWGFIGDDGSAATPGTVLERNFFAASEGPRLFPTPPPSTSGADLRSYVDSVFGFTAESATGEYLRAIQDLRNEWVLDGPQTAALTELLASLPDVIVFGETTDRLGRAAIAIGTRTRAQGVFEDVLLFDKFTGALIASEDTYLGGDPSIDLRSTTVVNYIVWKDPS